MTSHLERLGIFPAALVLLDAFLPGSVHPRFLSELKRGWLKWHPSIAPLDDELTAMSWYLHLFERWTPAAITTPTLLVRAREAIPTTDGDDNGPPSNDWRPGWAEPHAVAEVAGNHFTLMAEHAAAAAQAVHDWLSMLLPVSHDAPR
jgi:hypothetical protein